MFTGVLGDRSKRDRLEHLLVLQEILHHEERNALLFWACRFHLVWRSGGSVRVARRPDLPWLTEVGINSATCCGNRSHATCGGHSLLLKSRRRLHPVVVVRTLNHPTQC